ncbi:MAG: Holliday junction branch migration protein RuvA [Chloroflexota bacterium]|nr:Holliday junction branch migration protein RuvA [Chloroflexota bacterium]
MIASLSGRVKAIREDALVIEVGGVGFLVNVVANVLESVTRVGQSVELYTYMYVREKRIALYGFLTAEERELFTTLLGVSGVGPSTALAVLSTFSPEVLRGAIAQGDASTLAHIPGIGPKTAQRMLLDLRDKITVSEAWVPGMGEGDAEVIDALTALGYSVSEARSAVSGIPDEVEALDERILAALRYLGA